MMPAACIVCQRSVEADRDKIGLDTCRWCGDVAAKRELRVKQSHVGPAYNKGGPVYLGPSRQAALDAGRKTSADPTVDVVRAAPRPKREYVQRRVVGVFWDKRGDKYAWFEGVNPDDHGAVRKVYYADI